MGTVSRFSPSRAKELTRDAVKIFGLGQHHHRALHSDRPGGRRSGLRFRKKSTARMKGRRLLCPDLNPQSDEADGQKQAADDQNP